MDNCKVASELLKIAKELTDDEKPDFDKVAQEIVKLRNKYEADSAVGIFLGIVRDMAVYLKRGNRTAVTRLSQEMMKEFGK